MYYFYFALHEELHVFTTKAFVRIERKMYEQKNEAWSLLGEQVPMILTLV